MDFDDILAFVVFIIIFLVSLFSRKKDKGKKEFSILTPEQKKWLEGITGIRIEPEKSPGTELRPAPSEEPVKTKPKFPPVEVVWENNEGVAPAAPPPFSAVKKEDDVEEIILEEIETDAAVKKEVVERKRRPHLLIASVSELRKAVIWSEILARPVGLRDEEADGY